LNNDQPTSSSTFSPLIEQGYRESWKRYQQSLEAPAGSLPHWDWIVLTASDERQARAFELKIDWRRKAGLLPQGTRFLVVPDPQERRVGSGGATLNALAEVACRLAKASRLKCPHELATLFSRRRVLMLHSGGESRRLPHCSAFGKVFARVPRELPDGRASTLFDEFLISLSGLPFRMHEGVFVASGDVLLIFDHRQVDLARQGLVGVGAHVPAELGTRHGVYVSEPGGTLVRRFLHKMTLPELHSSGAVDESGCVAIDTGMVWFDATAAATLLGLFGFDERLEFSADGPFPEIVATSARLNLYSDLLMPLAAETKREEYLEDASDGAPAPVVRSMRPVIWEKLRTIPFHVETLSPVEFIHFGTTAEYVAVMTEGLEGRAALGWKTPVASFVGRDKATEAAVVLDSCLASVRPSGEHGSVVEDCSLGGDLALGGRCLLSHVWTDQPIALEPGVVVHQLPVIRAVATEEHAFVTQLYGIEDNPKLPFGNPAATFLNRSWSQWLSDAGITPDDLWGASGEGERSLWTARLFPVAPTRDESLARALWMQRPSAGGDIVRRQWLAAPRLSLAESARSADVLHILDDLRQLADLVPVCQYCAAIERQQPSANAAALLGGNPADVRRRAAAVAERFAHSPDPLLPIRGFKALADALFEHKGNKALLDEGRRFEDRAFELLAQLIREATPCPVQAKAGRRRPGEGKRRAVVEVPARIDFAGGWSDTPPFSIEYGGKVLNAAIRLRSRLPIRVECELLYRPVLVLESRDLDVSQEFDRDEAILDYADPSDPLALHKAGIVVAGLVHPRRRKQGGDLPHALDRALGGGLRVSTRVGLPHGSGLGTSSILAGAVLACLRVILGRPIEYETIFDEVLCLEQMLTTGGGWQDQVGGMVGGVKLSTTRPGLPQRPQIERVRLRPEAADQLRRRLLLVGTGQRRLAKGILRAIMGRYMSREPEALRILCDIREIAQRERLALEQGDLAEMGRLMTEHWQLNKRLDPGTSTPFIDRLFEVVAPYSSGGKLAGAGGGGFMILIARDEQAPARIAELLDATFHEPDISLWPLEIADEGLTVIETP